MKKIFLCTAILMASTALADDNNISGLGNTITDTHNGPNVGGSVAASASTHDTNLNTNVNTVLGGAGGRGGNANQKQGQKQGQVAKGGSVEGSGNSPVTITERQVHQAPAVFAPGLTNSFGNDSCLGSVSGGATTSIFGATLGGSTTDENCKRLKNSERADKKGFHKAALFILCKDEDFRQGMRYEKSESCPQDEASIAQDSQYVATPSVKHDYPSQSSRW